MSEDEWFVWTALHLGAITLLSRSRRCNLIKFGPAHLILAELAYALQYPRQSPSKQPFSLVITAD